MNGMGIVKQLSSTRHDFDDATGELTVTLVLAPGTRGVTVRVATPAPANDNVGGKVLPFTGRAPLPLDHQLIDLDLRAEGPDEEIELDLDSPEVIAIYDQVPERRVA